MTPDEYKKTMTFLERNKNAVEYSLWRWWKNYTWAKFLFFISPFVTILISFDGFISSSSTETELILISTLTAPLSVLRSLIYTTFPGFRMPLGSKVFLMPLIRAS